ncbi:SURF1 family protein [Roseomonas sp. HJA6]|uniref:SURF1-like protein n=1 Tax=Roseomonas alba TaxID=2846776 RepID=A0ABS7AEA0_9PROT|nr:SURF1 family protein [Neoroseomonas alba]MBW6400633.1 SURF1 family protein [Neoroseomonas alba]
MAESARRGRRLLLPSLVSFGALLVLLGLGAWQVERLAWKTALLAQFDAVEAGPPVPVTAAEPPAYAKVAATGRFDHTREALLGLEVRGDTLGAHLVTPLMRDGAPPILVDRGWVPFERTSTVAHPEGAVTVTGWVRPPETAGWFSPADDIPGRRLYTYDPKTIGAALGLTAVVPWTLVALADGTDRTTLPQPARGLPRPNNNHLGYAITWFGLAAGLVGVYLVWLRHRLKENA